MKIQATLDSTDAIESKKPNAFKKSLDWISKSKEDIVVIGGLTLLSAAIVTVSFWGGNKQDEGILQGIQQESEEVIPGFESIEIEGTMINYNPGSIHGAVVTLATGEVCDIQFTPVRDGGLLSFIGADDSRIVDFGTCPTSE